MRPHWDLPAQHRRRLTAALLLVLLVAGVGVWLALTNRNQDDRPPTTATAPTAATPPSPALGSAIRLLTRLPATRDPETFAKAVAHALFDWDTALATPLSDYTGRLLALGDPTGQETPGLAADLAGYLPTPEAWTLLKPYYTRQWLDISSIRIPALWSRAVAEADRVPGQGLAAGTTAYTIRGARHRTGVWEGEPVSSTHPVAFTVFMVCAPSYQTCHLLRLSRLDEPLD